MRRLLSDSRFRGRSGQGRIKRFLIEDQGSELLEFALSLPILLSITFGALELLLVLCCFVGATYGSRAAVRYASTHGAASLTPCTSADLVGIVKNYVVGLPGGQLTVTPTWVPSNAVGSAITVQVGMSYATGIPFTAASSMSVSTKATGIIVQ